MIVVVLACAFACKAQSSNSSKDPAIIVHESSAPSNADKDADERFVLEPGEDPDNRLLLPLLKHIVMDQEQFWTEPTRFHVRDLKWALPFVGVTAGFIASDQWWSKQVPDTPSQLSRSLNISDYSVYSLLGIGGGAFLLGQVKHDDHMSEAGLLSGEAAINSTGVAYLLKEITQRQRPTEGNGNGNFFSSGASFPSEHSAVAWSIASVMAHEYPGPLTQIAAYGLASAVTLTRVTARQHFPSDVIVGSALGWYFGRQTYRAHHDLQVGGGPWGAWSDETLPEKKHNVENMGSPYVPLDSWVYPALDRLIALGYVQSEMVGLRPWTRLQCARLIQDAKDSVPDEGIENASATHSLDALSRYFQAEIKTLDGDDNISASVDSVYSRVTGISGEPLRDGFHLGQTLINDDGRPYAEGFNNVTGFTLHGDAGPLYVQLQGEYQRAPGAPSYPASALEQLASADTVPAIPNFQSPTGRFRLLDSSIGFTFHNLQVSFGKQSLWLGPTVGGPFLFSDNAEPIPMLRFDQIAPIYIPGLSRILGPLRSEFAVGRMDGATWIFSGGKLYGPNISDQPFVHIDKVSFKPTANFEFGMGISAVFGGTGLPVTWGNFFKTYSSRCAVNTCNTVLSAGAYGDRRSAADFTYRLPHLRDWVTLYADSLVEDEISPIGSSRPAIQAGMYLPKIPKVPKLDLRAEAVYTDAPNTVFIGNYYDNGRYLSGYTNYGQILGSWIGRAGKGGQAWATYWFSPRSTLQFQYRREVVSQKFISGGGGLNDFGVKGTFRLSSEVSVDGFLQYETWKFPVLKALPETDVTTSVQLTYYPKWFASK